MTKWFNNCRRCGMVIPDNRELCDTCVMENAVVKACRGRKIDYTSVYRAFDPFSIKNVIFNPPATIVMWYNGDKTIVKCGEKDKFDPEKGLAMAIAKYYYGNKGNYYNLFKKWLPTKHDEVMDGLVEAMTPEQKAAVELRTEKERIAAIEKSMGDGKNFGQACDELGIPPEEQCVLVSKLLDKYES